MTCPTELLLGEVAAMLAEGRTVTLHAKGDSMYPFIVGGRDSVVLEPVRRVRVGDIVLARPAGKGYILHRVLRQEGDALRLMGDGNVCRGEDCLRGEVFGRVSAIVRCGRRVDCGSAAERWRVCVWRGLFPLRRVILGVCRRWPGCGYGKRN